MAAVTICSDFGAQEKKICRCFHFFLMYLPWSDGTGCHDHRFLNVEFKASLLTLLFLPHQELFSSSLSGIRVVSSAYLRFLMFLLAVLIPACDSSSLVFHMMYWGRVTTYSLVTLLCQFWTSPLFVVADKIILFKKANVTIIWTQWIWLQGRKICFVQGGFYSFISKHLILYSFAK